MVIFGRVAGSAFRRDASLDENATQPQDNCIPRNTERGLVAGKKNAKMDA